MRSKHFLAEVQSGILLGLMMASTALSPMAVYASPGVRAPASEVVVSPSVMTQSNLFGLYGLTTSSSGEAVQKSFQEARAWLMNSTDGRTWHSTSRAAVSELKGFESWESRFWIEELKNIQNQNRNVTRLNESNRARAYQRFYIRKELMLRANLVTEAQLRQMNLQQTLEAMKTHVSPNNRAKLLSVLDQHQRVLTDPKLRAQYIQAHNIQRPLGLPLPRTAEEKQYEQDQKRMQEEEQRRAKNAEARQSLKDSAQIRAQNTAAVAKEAYSSAKNYSQIAINRISSTQFEMIAEEGKNKGYRFQFSRLTPEEMKAQSPQQIVMGLNKGYLGNLSIQALSFWLAIGYVGGHAKMLMDYTENPILLEQRMDLVTSAPFAASLGTFFVVRDSVQTAMDSRAAKKQSKLQMEAMKNPNLMNSPQSHRNGFARSMFSSSGLTSLSVALIASSIVHNFSSGVVSCQKIQSPMISKRERDKHLQICNQAWEEWNFQDKFMEYAPMILSAFGAIVLFRMAAGALKSGRDAVANRSKGSGRPGPQSGSSTAQGPSSSSPRPGGESKVNPNFKTGHSGKMSTAVLDHPGRAFTPGNLMGASAGGKLPPGGISAGSAAAGPQAGGAAARNVILKISATAVGGVIGQIVIQTAGAFLFIEAFEFIHGSVSHGLIKPAQAGYRAGNAKNELEATLQQVFRSPETQVLQKAGEEENDANRAACGSKAVCIDVEQTKAQLKEFGQAQGFWRQNLLSRVYQAQNNWIDFVYKMTNRYQASEKLYRDVTEQIAARRAELRGKSLEIFSGKNKNQLVADFATDSLPLFRSEPLHAVGVLMGTSYINKKDEEVARKQLEEMQRILREIEDSKPRPSAHNEEGYVHEAPLPSEESTEEELSALEARRLQLREIGAGLDEKLASANKIPSPIRKHVEIVSRKLKSPNVVDQISALEDINRYVGFFNGTCSSLRGHYQRNGSCVFHEMLDQIRTRSAAPVPRPWLMSMTPMDLKKASFHLNTEIYNRQQLTIPTNLLPGQSYLSDMGRTLDMMGIDIWTHPDDGRYSEMTQFVLVSMLCGPSVNERERIFPIKKGYSREFTPPRILVADYSDYCMRQDIMKRPVTQNLFAASTNPATGESFTSIVDLLLRKADESVLGDNFESWWKTNVETSFQEAMQDAQKIYKETVIDELMVPLLNQSGHSKVGNMAGGVLLPNGLSRALAFELDYYLDEIMLPMYKMGRIHHSKNVNVDMTEVENLKREIVLQLDRVLDSVFKSPLEARRAHDLGLIAVLQFLVLNGASTSSEPTEVRVKLTGAEKELLHQAAEQIQAIYFEALTYSAIVGALNH